MNKLIIIFILLFSSCSTSVVIESTQCSKAMILFPKSLKKSKVNSFEYSSIGVGSFEIDLFKAFESKGHHCSKISEVSYEVKTTFVDVLIGIIPGVTSKTVKVYYK